MQESLDGSILYRYNDPSIEFDWLLSSSIVNTKFLVGSRWRWSKQGKLKSFFPIFFILNFILNSTVKRNCIVTKKIRIFPIRNWNMTASGKKKKYRKNLLTLPNVFSFEVLLQYFFLQDRCWTNFVSYIWSNNMFTLFLIFKHPVCSSIVG